MIGTGSGPPQPAGITTVAEFVERLRRLRAWQGNMSLPSLAKQSGIPTSTLHDALNRKRTTLPALELVLRIVNTLGGDTPAWEAAWRVVSLAPPGIPPKSAVSRPRQLPAGGFGFSGRLTELKRLNEFFDGWQDGGLTAGAVAIISGPPGVGKTALAVQWAHEVAEEFPDGQLYLDLRGFSPGAPVAHGSALTALISALGVAAEQIPAEVEAQASLFRSLVAERRMLIMLDNVRDVGHVRPLLPGSRTCFTLVTSRHALGGMVAREGARRLVLSRLSDDESRNLLCALLGSERVDREPAAIGELAELCGHLPLALRIVAANLIDRPMQTLSGYAQSLRTGNRLAALSIVDDEDNAVRTAFEASYSLLDPTAQQLFTRLGAVPWTSMTNAAAQALLVSPDAVTGLESLAAAHLIEPVSPGRYVMHDLLRLYATRFDGSPGEFAAWYLRSCTNALDRLRPGRMRLPAPPDELRTTPVEFASADEALSWLDAEKENLLSLAMHGPAPYSWLLVEVLSGYLALRNHTTEWIAAAQAALAAASAHGEPLAQAAMHASLGVARWTHDATAAMAHFEAARMLGRTAGNRRWQAAMLRSAGMLLRDQGRLAEALELLTEALEEFCALGDEQMAAIARVSLGVLLRNMGGLHQAAEHMRSALDYYLRSNDPFRIASTHASLGLVCRDLGVYAEAAEHEERAIAHFRQLKDTTGEAYAQEHLATIQLAQGRPAAAKRSARRAHTTATKINDERLRCDSLIVLGAAREQCDDPGGREDLTRALTLAREIDYPRGQIGALIGLSHVDVVIGRFSHAAERAELAVELASAAGFAVAAGTAQTALGMAYHRMGQDLRAQKLAEQALATHLRCGHEPGVTLARQLLALICGDA